MVVLAKRKNLEVTFLSIHSSEEAAWEAAAQHVDSPDPELKPIIARSLHLITNHQEEFLIGHVKINPELEKLASFIKENNIPSEDLDRLVADKFYEYSQHNDIYTQLDVLMALMNNFPELEQEIKNLTKKTFLERLFT